MVSVSRFPVGAVPAAEIVAGDAHVDAAAAGAFPCYLLFFCENKRKQLVARRTTSNNTNQNQQYQQKQKKQQQQQQQQQQHHHHTNTCSNDNNTINITLGQTAQPCPKCKSLQKELWAYGGKRLATIWARGAAAQHSLTHTWCCHSQQAAS